MASTSSDQLEGQPTANGEHVVSEPLVASQPICPVVVVAPVVVDACVVEPQLGRVSATVCRPVVAAVVSSSRRARTEQHGQTQDQCCDGRDDSPPNCDDFHEILSS